MSRIGLVLLFLAIVIPGCDSGKKELDSSEAVTEVKAVEPIVEVKTIQDGSMPETWMGARLESEKDLPICGSEWREMVDFPGYPLWECDEYHGRIVGVASDGKTVVTFTIASENEGDFDFLKACEEVPFEDKEKAKQAEEKGVLSFSCGDFLGWSLKSDGKGLVLAWKSKELWDAMGKARDEMPSFDKRIELGNFAYEVNSVTPVKTLGSRFSQKDASEGARFVVVDYKIENLGNETTTVMAGDFILVDHKGRKFNTSSSAETALSMSGDADMLVSELHPGLKSKQKTAFEVPEAVLGKPMSLIIPEKGFGKGQIEYRFLLPKAK